MQLGRGHTKGDTVVWLPQEKILFSGDLVEYDATPYTGDAYFDGLAGDARRDRGAQAAAARARPRRRRCTTPAEVPAGLDGTRAFVTAMFDSGEARRGRGQGPERRLQGDLRRAQAASSATG